MEYCHDSSSNLHVKHFSFFEGEAKKNTEWLGQLICKSKLHMSLHTSHANANMAPGVNGCHHTKRVAIMWPWSGSRKAGIGVQVVSWHAKSLSVGRGVACGKCGCGRWLRTVGQAWSLVWEPGTVIQSPGTCQTGMTGSKTGLTDCARSECVSLRVHGCVPAWVDIPGACTTTGSTLSMVNQTSWSHWIGSKSWGEGCDGIGELVPGTVEMMGSLRLSQSLLFVLFTLVLYQTGLSSFHVGREHIRCHTWHRVCQWVVTGTRLWNGRPWCSWSLDMLLR